MIYGVPSGWLDLAQVMEGSKWLILRHCRSHAALPALASGLRMQQLLPHWHHSVNGLRRQPDLGYLSCFKPMSFYQQILCFAALIILDFFAVALYLLIDHICGALLLASWSTI